MKNDSLDNINQYNRNAPHYTFAESLYGTDDGLEGGQNNLKTYLYQYHKPQLSI